ncbi:hypothetical protein SEA_NICEHOUSE_81 [Rhodococcus phage NiceHouse]|nr:hypothetical protein SEA_NICEHOUSE_81 [Rhodococcus phage NiceHouse]
MVTGIILLATAAIVIVAASLIKTVEMSNKTKSFIALGVSIVGGLVAAVIENGGFEDFTASGLTGTILIVYGLSTAIYKLVWPDSVDSFLENSLITPSNGQHKA